MNHLNKQTEVTTNLRKIKRGGIDYLVVPGTPVREQVLNDYLLPAEEIGKFFLAWNGAPVTLQHPKDNDGSANVPYPDAPVIGNFYNAAFDGSRLTGEYWLDEKLLLAHSPETHKRIMSGQMVETSTGYRSDVEDAHGIFKGIEYKTIHRNIHPDHIAILPHEIGACSVLDGCGVNRNSCDNCKTKNKTKGKSMNLKEFLAMLTGAGYKVKVNEAQGQEPSFEVEPPATPAPPEPKQEQQAPIVSFTPDEIKALKALAQAAPVIQNAAQALAAEGQSRKNVLIQSVKANSANPFGDTELQSMSESALMKLNAHLNTNFSALGESFTNESNLIAEAPDTFSWAQPTKQGAK